MTTKAKAEKKKKKSTEGPPIWVESLMTREEWKENVRKFPTTCHIPEPVEYNPNYHKGGKWRDRMGRGYTPEEIIKMNKTMDNLGNILAEIKSKAEQQTEDETEEDE